MLHRGNYYVDFEIAHSRALDYISTTKNGLLQNIIVAHEINYYSRLWNATIKYLNHCRAMIQKWYFLSCMEFDIQIEIYIIW